MVSHKSLRVMGYVYVGIFLIGSLLMIINSGQMVNVTDRGGNSEISITSIVSLMFSLITIVFTLMLLFGMIMRQEIFVTDHLRFITTIYIIHMIALCIGCIVAGVAIGYATEGGELGGLLVILATIGFCILLMITLIYILSVWILSIIELINHDQSRLEPSEMIIPNLL